MSMELGVLRPVNHYGCIRAINTGFVGVSDWFRGSLRLVSWEFKIGFVGFYDWFCRILRLVLWEFKSGFVGV